MCFAPQPRELFDISTSKGASKLVWFVHFDFEICFAPQLRPLFRRNFQKCSDTQVLCTFWLGNVLRATAVSTFSTQLPKVLRHWSALYILTGKCASRHSGVPSFNVSTSKSVSTLRCLRHFDFHMRFAPQRRAIFHLASSQMAPHPPL